MLLFAAIITFCSLLSFMSLFWLSYLQVKSPFLGGLYVFGSSITDDQTRIYQAGTVVVISVAFAGAYLALFRRLLDQLNNDDIYPISFHYYSIWLISAMVIGAIVRHVAGIFGVNAADSAIILVIAFAIGAAPSPFFSRLIHWAFNRLEVWGDKDDPKKEDRPSNLNLLMIDGLQNAKIDRLSELDINDAQVLACQNPFTLWVRLPYDLGLIVDWISQAQLYVCVRDDGLQKARNQEITDIHKFVSLLKDGNASAALCKAIGLEPSFVPPLLASLEHDPSFVRLREVKVAMVG
jgi:hypothetical protein